MKAYGTLHEHNYRWTMPLIFAHAYLHCTRKYVFIRKEACAKIRGVVPRVIVTMRREPLLCRRSASMASD